MDRFVVTLIGKVNAGKSALCNALLGHDLASVAPIAGWTKEVSLFPLGDDVAIADTPGLGDVDAEVAARTFDFLGETDLFLHVVNADEGLTSSVRDAHSRMVATRRPVIVVCNKADHLDARERKAVARQLSKQLGTKHLIVTSAARGDGVPELAEALRAVLRDRGEELRFMKYVSLRGHELVRAADAAAEAAADSAILWATGRAAAIAAVPLPLADVYPLVTNELYMVKQIGTAYGLELSESAVKGLLTAMGASFAGLVIASFFPGVKVAVAASVTYGAGQAAKAWCTRGGTMSDSELRKHFERERGRHRKLPT